ncbi:hypothetical protein FIC94_08520 [Ochrobactrum teleogrylli]|uniref:Uncharacterized protein n=1 Tax=Ochrobactrum teleogrylli TaxID=2479765 RepID=A0ABY2Y8D4_9HYPH|nr:hypothetical protein FIC94_08520 [[Ochrobactrum] teleogrylli]
MWEPLYLFVFTHYPTHRSGIRNQSSGLISPRRRCALLLDMLYLSSFQVSRKLRKLRSAS